MSGMKKDLITQAQRGVVSFQLRIISLGGVMITIFIIFSSLMSVNMQGNYLGAIMTDEVTDTWLNNIFTSLFI